MANVTAYWTDNDDYETVLENVTLDEANAYVARFNAPGYCDLTIH